MTLSDRDRKLMFAVIPVVVIVAYWFLLLAPKREEAASASNELAKQQERLTTAQGKVTQASSAKTDFAADYTEVVRLGKAVPAAVDMPGLLVQLDQAAAGTDIHFTKIGTGEREGSATPTPPSGGDTQPPAAAGGQPAQSAPGGAAESANNASATSDQANQAAGGQPATPAGGTSASTPAAGAPAGLETVPLELEFQGNFFNLADFFHRVKRLVRVANQNVVVSGRLVTIEGVKYTSDPELFPQLKAELQATIYLVPAAQGTSAGATPQGPSATTPAGGSQPAPGSSGTPPTAAATP